MYTLHYGLKNGKCFDYQDVREAVLEFEQEFWKLRKEIEENFLFGNVNLEYEYLMQNKFKEIFGDFRENQTMIYLQKKQIVKKELKEDFNNQKMAQIYRKLGYYEYKGLRFSTLGDAFLHKKFEDEGFFKNGFK